MNPSGFLNTVKVFVEFIENGTRTPVLFFEGQITSLEMPLQNTSTLRCLSNTTRLTQINLEGAGIGIEKIAQLDTGTDNNAPVAEGVYVPESAMLPLSVSDDVQAYIHQTQLTQKEIANDALGTKDDTGFLTASDFKVQGGVFDDPVLLNYKTAYRYKTARSALEKLTKVETYLTTLLTDFENTPEVEEHISARGNIAFDTEAGRISRLPTDWVYDATGDRLFVLLSNPSRYIPDHLVEYRFATDSSHILREFDPTLVAYGLTTGDADTFYVLCGTATDLDPSDASVLDTEGYTRRFDASEATSDIQILKYIRSANWVDTFV